MANEIPAIQPTPFDGDDIGHFARSFNISRGEAFTQGLSRGQAQLNFVK